MHFYFSYITSCEIVIIKRTNRTKYFSSQEKSLKLVPPLDGILDEFPPLPGQIFPHHGGLHLGAAAQRHRLLVRAEPGVTESLPGGESLGWAEHQQPGGQEGIRSLNISLTLPFTD